MQNIYINELQKGLVNELKANKNLPMDKVISNIFGKNKNLIKLAYSKNTNNYHKILIIKKYKLDNGKEIVFTNSPIFYIDEVKTISKHELKSMGNSKSIGDITLYYSRTIYSYYHAKLVTQSVTGHFTYDGTNANAEVVDAGYTIHIAIMDKYKL